MFGSFQALEVSVQETPAFSRTAASTANKRAPMCEHASLSSAIQVQCTLKQCHHLGFQPKDELVHHLHSENGSPARKNTNNVYDKNGQVLNLCSIYLGPKSW